MASKLTQEYVLNFLKDYNFYVSDGFIYKNSSIPIDFFDKNNYWYHLSFWSLKGILFDGYNPSPFHADNPHTVENIQMWIKNENKNFKLISSQYIHNSKKLEFVCNDCGRQFYRTLPEIFKRDYCYYCKGTRWDISRDVPEILELYQLGNTMDEISNKLNICKTKISKVLKDNNIKIKNTVEYKSSQDLVTQRKYYCNENIFENIDSHDKAYWLGFLFADGNVSVPKGKNGGTKGIRIELSLKEEDYYHLRNFSSFLESNYPVKKKIVKLLGKEFIAYRVSIGSVKMGKDLISHGCVPNKSLVLEYSKDLDDEYFGSFLCGYFDGDGCLAHHIYHYGNNTAISDIISILGTFELLSVIDNKLESLGIKTRRGVVKSHSKAFMLEISNFSHVDFYNLIYNKSSYLLGRKLEKFREMLDHRERDYDISPIAKLAKLIMED